MDNMTDNPTIMEASIYKMKESTLEKTMMIEVNAHITLSILCITIEDQTTEEIITEVEEVEEEEKEEIEEGFQK
jgi:hypothetical protein